MIAPKHEGEEQMQPVQIRMARAALNLSVDELATRAGLSHVDIARLESGESAGDGLADRLRAVFDQAGIEMIDDDAVRSVATSAGIVPLEELNSANDE